MFLLFPNAATVIDSYLSNWFTKSRDSIMELHTKIWKEEDISGSSKKYTKVMSYYSAMYLVLLIYLEWKAAYNRNWDDYITKYDLVNKRNELACCGIDLDDILTSFGLPVLSITTGINSIQTEETFIVEPTTLPVVNDEVVVSIIHLVNTDSEEISYIS